jgi:hypothetical protein
MAPPSYSPGMPSSLPPSPTTPIAGAPTQIPGIMGPGARPIPWALLASLGRLVGLLLLFVGTLVAVLFASPPADCYTSACGNGTLSDIQYGILTSHLLWTLGAAALLAGASIKLHYVLSESTASGADGNSRFLAQRRTETALVLVSIGILLVLLLTAGTAA